ncbi:MAG: hypothetical protein ACRDP3_12025, partial [Streptomyces sp.]|uniref:hypothetical protein n=1 Tax=Streptomyces sp. TaxID=1931 RepID=UPI003D6B25EF
MTRWALPRPEGGSSPAVTRSRRAIRAGLDGAMDVLHPLVTLVRGMGRLVLLAVRWWARTPKDRRGPVLFLLAVGVLVVALLPWGRVCAVVVVVGAAAWHGREPAGRHACAGPSESESARLQAVYEALVPYFALPDDPGPEPLFAHDGGWERAFEEVEFTEEGRLERLRLRYPAYFRDGDMDCRLPVERLLSAKSGRGREYRFAWDEEGNRLEMTVPEPLPLGIHAQRFVTGPGEILLGFTDAGSVHRTVPVTHGGQARDVPPVMWRTGARSAEPHLLTVGAPGAGTSTLLRSVVLQALQHGDVLLVDGSGAGEFACLSGRAGVLATETSLVGALASVEWVVHETERRLSVASMARGAGQTVPDDARRPLWLVLDRPAVLSQLARAAGRRDPQELLQVPLRHGRGANVTVAVAEHFEDSDGLGRAVHAYTGARVLLGAASPEQARTVLGTHAPPLP